MGNGSAPYLHRESTDSLIKLKYKFCQEKDGDGEIKVSAILCISYNIIIVYFTKFESLIMYNNIHRPYSVSKKVHICSVWEL